MKSLLKENWGIDADVVEEFTESTNPFCNGKNYIIDDKYFLKSDIITNFDLKENELKILKVLKGRGIPVLVPVGEKIIDVGFKTYQLFDYMPETEVQTSRYKSLKPNIIAKHFAKISSISLTSFKDIEEKHIATDIERLRGMLKNRLKDKDLELYENAYSHLKKNLFPFLPYFNIVFAHGDLHPGNILFSMDDIKAFIDWELSSAREELYDLAFFLGCVGIDGPLALDEDWVKEFLISFVEEAKPSKLSFYLLPELVLATRLEWLYKWLRNPKDQDIIRMELELIDILLDNIEDIRKLWLSYIKTDFKYSKNKWVMQDSFIVEEIDKAKEQLKAFDLFSDYLSIKDINDPERFSTDLRLLAIDYGMKEDIINVIKTNNLLRESSDVFPDNKYILVERVVALGNSCLDFSRFRLIDALDRALSEVKSIMTQNPDIDELNIGYAFVLRNSSIAYAEIGRFKTSFDMVEELIKLNLEHDNIELKGELARALSNAITTILSHPEIKGNHDILSNFSAKLQELFDDDDKSRKIHGAFQIAKANLKKTRSYQNLLK